MHGSLVNYPAAVSASMNSETEVQLHELSLQSIYLCEQRSYGKDNTPRAKPYQTIESYNTKTVKVHRTPGSERAIKDQNDKNLCREKYVFLRIFTLKHFLTQHIAIVWSGNS